MGLKFGLLREGKKWWCSWTMSWGEYSCLRGQEKSPCLIKNLCSLRKYLFIDVIKSWRLRWEGHVPHMTEE